MSQSHFPSLVKLPQSLTKKIDFLILDLYMGINRLWCDLTWLVSSPQLFPAMCRKLCFLVFYARGTLVSESEGKKKFKISSPSRWKSLGGNAVCEDG